MSDGQKKKIASPWLARDAAKGKVAWDDVSKEGLIVDETGKYVAMVQSLSVYGAGELED